MKNLRLSILVILCLVFAAPLLYTQTDTLSSYDNPSIKVGQKYKFTLFDDSQVTGKVTAINGKFVTVLTKDKAIVTLLKDNILFFTTDLTPDKYNFSFALTGGVAFGRLGSLYYNDNGQRGASFNLSGYYYFSETKAIKLDVGFAYTSQRFQVHNYYAGQPEPDKFEGGEMTHLVIKPSIVIGEFKPKNFSSIYASLGLGWVMNTQKQLIHTYYLQNYNTYEYEKKEHIIPEQSYTGMVISAGLELSFRLKKNLSIMAETEANVFTIERNWQTQFPIRLGVSYFLY